MQKNVGYKVEIVFLVIGMFLFSVQDLSSQTICVKPDSNQIKGEKDGYTYELWNQNSEGRACIALYDNALFGGEWDGVENYLARRGLSYNKTKEHQEIGVFSTIYDCNYQPDSASGNSYLSVYGWTVNPLIEYYIIEDWRNWTPSKSANATLKGAFAMNGSIYDVYENTRVNKPSIIGKTTFQQYFSIRRDSRNKGKINISEHFNMWEELGLKMGKISEVSFVVEGYKSKGKFEFVDLEMMVE